MALKSNDRFENHMDVSSPETIGDAEKISDFSEESHDPYDDKFDEMLDGAEHSFEHDSANIIDDKKATDDTTHHLNDGSEKNNSMREPAHLGEDSSDKGKVSILTESKVDANFQYGEGGGTQYFIRNASDMKKDGRLVQVSVEPLRYDAEAEPMTTESSNNNHPISKDLRPLNVKETEQLESTIDYDNVGNDADYTAVVDAPLSGEEIHYLDENTLEEGALTRVAGDAKQQRNEDWKQQLSDQESSGGIVFPDGVSNPRELVAGETYYQLSALGYPRESPYFTDRETVDSCRDASGKVDIFSLMKKLQIPPKRDDSGNIYRNYLLTQYVYFPDGRK